MEISAPVRAFVLMGKGLGRAGRSGLLGSVRSFERLSSVSTQMLKIATGLCDSLVRSGLVSFPLWPPRSGSRGKGVG